MRDRVATFVVLLSCCLAAAAADPKGAGAEPAAVAAPAAHDHGHHMEPWMYDALRRKVALYKNYSNEEIDLSMKMMGPDYVSYLSGGDVRGKTGVLVLAHGFGQTGDQAFRKTLAPVGEDRPTAVAFGMSMTQSSHIQSAVDQLAAAGAATIVVLPALSSAWVSQNRQWQYMFDLTDNPGYLETTRIKSPAKLIYSEPLADDPLVAEILFDYAKEITDDPGNTLLIVLSHGPEGEDDNRRTLAMLDGLAQQVKEKGGFREARAVSLQNDAPRDLYHANVARFRAMVEAANKEGRKVVVVTNLLAPRGIQNQIREHLEGLDYKFNAKGVVQHPNFVRWVEESVRRETGRSG
jgi:sirohydrochlorin ferrochelatase